MPEPGAEVRPATDVPFDVARDSLYSPEELFAGLADGYAATLDARVYAWDRAGRARERTLAAALHDHAIDDALEEHVVGRRFVGVMGGHDAARGSAAYRTAALLGHALGSRATVATGGGPGAMEAANLGAFLSGESAAALADAVDRLAATPTFADVTAWARVGLEVRREHPRGLDNLGVPTWFYGHEPPNVFATHVAKYFHNAIREDVLLRVCTAGIVFLPGAAGTVQEVFQDACENYYADPTDLAPMVLLGREHWTQTLPVWPLLRSLAEQRPDGGMRVHLTDSVEEAVELLER